jgi:hypothetical protein
MALARRASGEMRSGDRDGLVGPFRLFGSGLSRGVERPAGLRQGISSSRLTAGSSNGGHVSAVAAYDFATFAARATRLVGAEFMSAALRVSRSSALARDLTLLAHIHRCETSPALGRLRIDGRHLGSLWNRAQRTGLLTWLRRPIGLPMLCARRHSVRTREARPPCNGCAFAPESGQGAKTLGAEAQRSCSLIDPGTSQ